MAIEFFKAVIYLPMIVICMIISQIYFEQYLIKYRDSRLVMVGLTLIIIITYFALETGLIQLTLLNLQEIAFVQIIPVTMVFRGSSFHKVWWWLLIITPCYVNFIKKDAMPLLSSYWLWAGEGVLLFIICWLLVHWQGPSKVLRYFIAVLSLSVVELSVLYIARHLELMRGVVVTIGLLVIAGFEAYRYTNELSSVQELKALQVESERDDLTGLLNYRSLSKKIKKLTDNHEVKNIVIGAIDIDHFKKINDTYGHFVGNEILNSFSTILRNRIHQAFPHHGYVYRFGGEEFSIVISNYSQKEAYQVLQAIEEELVQKPIKTRDNFEIVISFSCSLTNRLKDESLEATLKRADKMLYSVKNSGRGWIVTDRHYNSENKY